MSPPKTVVYIVSDVDKALAFEWVAFSLKSRYRLCFILVGNGNTALERYLNGIGVFCSVVSDEEYPGYGRKWFRIFNLIAALKPQVIHSHLWRANLLGLTVGWLLRTKRRIFTRHHATLHYAQFPSGRKWDILCNFLATDVIAISQNVLHILRERDKAPAIKIRLIHHGFDLDYFQHIERDRVEALRRKYGIERSFWPVIGVVARYLEWKGIQYVIPAFREILNIYPNAHLVLANAHGDYSSRIRELLSSIPNAYTEILYEEDIGTLYQLFDAYIHTPVDDSSEAFGQTYVEAMAAGVPSVFTLSGVASEFVQDRHNALVVPFRDSQAIYQAIDVILRDERLRSKLIENGKLSAASFSINKMTNLLVDLYDQ